MSAVSYNGYQFSTGDNILFRIRGSNFIKGRIYVYSSDRFYLCSNDPSLKGTAAPDLLGYNNSWFIALRGDGSVNEPNDRDLGILPIVPKLEPYNLKINSRLIEFLYSNYKSLLPLFYLNLDPINRYTEIKDSEDGFVELVTIKNGAPISVKIKLGRLLRALAVNYNELFDTKLNKIDLSDAIVEKIHNLWKSFASVISYDIKKGQDILDIAYNSAKYHVEGHLKSCMTNQTSYLSLYRDNPLQINAMVFYKDNQVCGRCILWKCTDDKWYHDRLYSSFDFVRPSMMSILRELGYECLHGSSLKHEAKVDKIDYAYYPYMDSLKIIDKENKIFRNKN